jgi:Flp pilus assembly protein TadB
MGWLCSHGAIFATGPAPRAACPQESIALIAAVVTGIAAAWLLWRLASICQRSLDSLGPSWRYDHHRRRQIARRFRVFRWFNPLVEDLREHRALHAMGRIERVRSQLRTGSEAVGWTAEEFLATAATRAVLVAGACAMVLSIRLGPLGAGLIGSIIAALAFYGELWRLRKRSTQRRRLFLRSLPFAVDLMAMTMEAGAGFRESLDAVVRHSSPGPLREEFAEVLRQIHHGQSLAEALAGLELRMPDDEVREIVFAVRKASEFGAPLQQTLLRLADEIRLRRVQSVEQAAGRANANVTFPGLITMIACILLILGPFVLNAISQAQTAF